MAQLQITRARLGKNASAANIASFISSTNTAAASIDTSDFAKLSKENQFNNINTFNNLITVNGDADFNSDLNVRNNLYANTNLFVERDLILNGNLSVAGSIDTYNQSELNIGDSFINLASAGEVDIDGGVRIYGSGTTIKSELFFDVSENDWYVNNNGAGDKLVYHSGNVNNSSTDWAAKKGAFSSHVSVNNAPASYPLDIKSNAENTAVTGWRSAVNDNLLGFIYETSGNAGALYLRDNNNENTVRITGDEYSNFIKQGNFGIGTDSVNNKLVVNTGLANDKIVFNTTQPSYDISFDIGYDLFAGKNGYSLKYVGSGSGDTNYLQFNSLNIGNTPFTHFQLHQTTPVIDMYSSLNANSDITLTGELSSNNFTSGFVGNGFNVDSSGNAEFNGLNVRGTLTVNELLINQIRATNGSLFVSDSMKFEVDKGSDSAYYRIGVDIEGGTRTPPFVVGDIILSQKFDGQNVKRVLGVVAAKNTSYINIAKSSVTGGAFEIGDTLVRIGNTTDTNRQGALYLTNSESNSPYLDIFDGFNSTSDSFDSKVRLGKLDGINYEGQNLSGYGLFSDNVYLKGAINATSGLIGNIDINSNSIGVGGDWQLNSNGSGQLANSKISWDNSGNLNFDSSVKLEWNSSNLLKTPWKYCTWNNAHTMSPLFDNYSTGTRNAVVNDLSTYNFPSHRRNSKWSWLMRGGDTGDSWEGGLIHSRTFNTNQAYLMAFWVRTKGVVNGISESRVYFGLDSGGFAFAETGTDNTNPYFDSHTSTAMSDQWYLYVGYIYPKNSELVTGDNSKQISGIYNESGVRVSHGYDMVFRSSLGDTYNGYFRVGFYRASSGDAALQDPQLYIADGSEPSLSQLLGMDRNLVTSITNDTISTCHINTNTATIGNFTMGANELHNANGNKHLHLINTESATTLGSSRARRGFTIYNDNSTLPSSNSTKCIRIGMLANKDTLTTFPSTPNYGIQIVKGTSPYKDVFRADSSGAMIAGFDFNENILSAQNDTIKLDSSTATITLKNDYDNSSLTPEIEFKQTVSSVEYPIGNIKASRIDNKNTFRINGYANTDIYSAGDMNIQAGGLSGGGNRNIDLFGMVKHTGKQSTTLSSTNTTANVDDCDVVVLTGSSGFNFYFSKTWITKNGKTVTVVNATDNYCYLGSYYANSSYRSLYKGSSATFVLWDGYWYRHN